MHFGFSRDVVKMKIDFWLGCTKALNPGIAMIWHWRPQGVHNFGTHPSLIPSVLPTLAQWQTEIKLVWCKTWFVSDYNDVH